MRILLTGKNASQDLDEGFPTSLRSNASRLNYVLCSSLNDEPDVVICVDFENRNLPILRRAKRMRIPRVLVKQEPIVVFPQHRYLNPHGIFDHVITKGISTVKGVYNYGNTWPQEIQFSGRRKRRFVAVTANKWSAINGQLYELRKEVYASDDRIDVFGRGWHVGRFEELGNVVKESVLAAMAGIIPKPPKVRILSMKPRNYHGAVADKRAVMSAYDFSLIIENCSFYTSEKLMDSLLVGNFPIYVGGSLHGSGIPREFVIESEANCSSVIGALDMAMGVDTERFRKNLMEWLREPSTREKWSANAIWARILREVESTLDLPESRTKTKMVSDNSKLKFIGETERNRQL